MTPKYKFEIVPGFFRPGKDIAKDYDGLVPTVERLSILDRNYETDDGQPAAQWARFKKYVNYLNKTSDENTSYKLFYVLRHGVGVHNVVMNALNLGADPEEKPPKKIWNNKFSLLEKAKAEDVNVDIIDDEVLENMDDAAKAVFMKNDKHQVAMKVLKSNVERSLTPPDNTLEWADALLVEEGIAQAKALAAFWKKAVENDGMPWPQSIYTSPLTRCLETTQIVYNEILERKEPRPVVPIVKEALRERLTPHPCDRRSPLSKIKEMCPKWTIEQGFEEEDVLWQKDPTLAEEEAPHARRKQSLLEDIFEHDDNQFISLTAHSYALTALLIAIGAGNEKFRISESAMVPLFVKGVRISSAEGTNTTSS
ncbi:hypothetical protein E8E14_006582 [Neopestalotiopsis sp. 37M]|nr:hypothetical protein E8E14_006582 [Neopestalotiopsis sp. 37M]